MPDTIVPWPWVSLAVMGAFHGLNPGMGWLFAVALGLQERKLSAVTRALGPIAVGHALAIALAAIVASMAGLVLPTRVLLVIGGVTLLGFAAYKVATRFRHPRWVGMRVNARQLVLWSFVMASAHGAGLMLVPVLIYPQGDSGAHSLSHAGHIGHHVPAANDALGSALVAVGIHTVAMFAVAALLAVIVYQKVGVEILRRAWINLDLIWAGALVAVGALALFLALVPGLPG
jgi:hypothetical protein